jgi:hypothetical protein
MSFKSREILYGSDLSDEGDADGASSKKKKDSAEKK